MKYRLYIVAAILISLAGCKKSTDNINADSASLIGKWNYTAYYYSIGGPIIWNTVTAHDQWIKFNNDGSCSSNTAPFNDIVGYQLTDSTHIQFNRVSGQPALLYSYTLEPTQRALYLSDAINICIEGCAQKFTK